MIKTKIDWCDSTINPVIGCPNRCKYCYAERLNRRFHYIPNWNDPQFFPDRLDNFRGYKNRSIFIDSMSDIGCWKPEWFEQVMDTIQQHLAHDYIALTKRSDNLLRMRNDYAFNKKKALGNVYFGATITNINQSVLNETNTYMDFLSIEPLLGPCDSRVLYDLLRQSVIKVLILGAETGRREGKVIPERKWVDDIVSAADKYGTPVFMKGSLRRLMGDDFRQDKLPWTIRK